MKTKLSEGGRMVIPVNLRNRFGLRTGNTVEIFCDGDCILLNPVRADTPPVPGHAFPNKPAQKNKRHP